MDSRHTRRLTHHSRGATPRYGIHGTAMRNAAAIALAGLASLLMTQAVHAGDRGPAALAAVQIATAGNGHGAPACAACHGPNGEGNSVPDAPRIAALPASYAQRQLENFADGKRASTIMMPIAKGLLPTERTAIAGFYARKAPVNAKAATTAESAAARVATPVPSAVAPAVAPVAAGTPTSSLGPQLALRGRWTQELPACTQCHGRGGVGVDEAFPPLTGQPVSYLENQLRAWQSGTRDPGPQGLMAGIAKKLSAADIRAVAQYFSELPRDPAEAQQAPTVRGAAAEPSATGSRSAAPPTEAGQLRESGQGAFTPPDESDLPAAEFGNVVRLGERIFVDTRHTAAGFVGNTLNCSSCHLDAGRKADSAPLWAAYVAYPEYRAKNHRVNTFAERLQGCFEFSMNGKAPPLGNPVLVALESYAYWLASGAPISRTLPGRGYPKLPPPAAAADYGRGKLVYEQHCALCHGADGAGRQARDGSMAFPALWGDGSFNWGAGMAGIANAAAFIEANMPLSQPTTLTPQEAWDVAHYMDSHERPQDPRFTESVRATRAKFHDSPDSMYGVTVDGHVLGSGSAQPGGVLRTRHPAAGTSSADR
jgi:thiosulfate dehydrogenase